MNFYKCSLPRNFRFLTIPKSYNTDSCRTTYFIKYHIQKFKYYHLIETPSSAAQNTVLRKTSFREHGCRTCNRFDITKLCCYMLGSLSRVWEISIQTYRKLRIICLKLGFSEIDYKTNFEHGNRFYDFLWGGG